MPPASFLKLSWPPCAPPSVTSRSPIPPQHLALFVPLDYLDHFAQCRDNVRRVAGPVGYRLAVRQHRGGRARVLRAEHVPFVIADHQYLTRFRAPTPRDLPDRLRRGLVRPVLPCDSDRELQVQFPAHPVHRPPRIPRQQRRRQPPPRQLVQQLARPVVQFRLRYARVLELRHDRLHPRVFRAGRRRQIVQHIHVADPRLLLDRRKVEVRRRDRAIHIKYNTLNFHRNRDKTTSWQEFQCRTLPVVRVANSQFRPKRSHL